VKVILPSPHADSLGKQAVRVSYVGTRQIWAGPLSGNRVVVALVNENGGASDTFGASWGQLQLTPGTTATARNLWTVSDRGLRSSNA
jgi:alpha-galactosidase